MFLKPYCRFGRATNGLASTEPVEHRRSDACHVRALGKRVRQIAPLCA